MSTTQKLTGESAIVTGASIAKLFDLNLLGLLLCTKDALNHFGPEGGSFINISSIVSTYAPPATSVYSATKGAVDTITRALAKELGGRKIRMNAINPGVVDTEGTQSAGIVGKDNEFRKIYEATAPLGRNAQPQGIASAAVFLASSDPSWVTGEM